MRLDVAVVCTIVTLAAVVPAAAQVPGRIEATPATNSLPAFPEGAHIAYVDLDKIVALSAEGKAINERLQQLRSKKGAEVEGRSQQVQALQGKLAASDLLNDQAKAQLQREFDRAKVDFERFSEDAQAEVQQMQQQMQIAFGQKLFPVIGEIAREKNLWAVFSADSPLLWHDPRIDISEEVARRIDAAPAQPEASPKP